MHWFGIFADQYIALVMERLGPNLDHVRRLYHRQMPLSLVVGIGERLVSAIEVMHANSIVHRDIKPSNMAIRLHSPLSRAIAAGDLTSSRHMSSLAEDVYLIDFGSSQRFLTDPSESGEDNDMHTVVPSKWGDHIRYRESQWFVGTVRFSSLPALMEVGTLLC